MSVNIALKIIANDVGATKTVIVQGNDSVHTVCRDVREKFGVRAGGADHALFYPMNGKWLLSNKVIDFYNLKSGDLLEYKKKHRPIKVRMLDGALKTIIIDESLPVSMVVETICEKIGIIDAVEYSLLPDKESESSKNKKDKNGNITEESKWLNSDKTLSEQFIVENDVVILKKKYFFNDQNIDKHDPVQLNLVYNQSRETMISGKYPCSLEEAVQFAAFICQIQFGNYDATKHKPGYLILKDHLPQDYVKTKDVEKKIYTEYAKLKGLNPIDAKNRYVQLSRSLKTYGYTFFLVKEKNTKNNNKLVPCLLGVTKQTIVRFDYETKDIIQQWPLTQVRRWAAAPNSFTLDFGDYADAFYTVQTTEGTQIAALISGYVGIIIKKRKEAEKVTPEGFDGIATIEEFMKPGRATGISVASSGLRTAMESKLDNNGVLNSPRTTVPLNYSSFSGSSGFDNPDQQIALLAIKQAYATINNSVANIGTLVSLPPLGSDPASLSWRQQTIDVNSNNIVSVVSHQLAIVGSLVLQVTGDSSTMNYEIIASSIAQLPNMLARLIQNLKMLRTLLNDEELKETLLSSGLDIANALAKVIIASQPICTGDLKAKTDFHDAAHEYSALVSELLSSIKLLEVTERSEKELLDACNAVAKAVGDMILKSKSIVKRFENSQLLGDVSAKIMGTFEATNRLVTATMIIHPSISEQICKEQVIEGAEFLKDRVNALCNNFDVLTDQNDIDALAEASRRIQEALANLLNCAIKIGHDVHEYDELDEQFNNILEVIDDMVAAYGNTEAVVANARDLTLATTQYINQVKQRVESYENESGLMAAARVLAVSTAKMVACAKAATKNPEDQEKQGALEASVMDIRKAIAKTATPEIRTNALSKLGRIVKEVISSLSQVTNASENAAMFNRNQSSQIYVNQNLKKINELNPGLIAAVKNYYHDKKDMLHQNKLLQNARSVVYPGHTLISSIQAAIPTVGDHNLQQQLASSSTHFEFNIRDLEKLVNLMQDVLAQVSVKEALSTINEIQITLQHAEGNSKKRPNFDIGASSDQKANQIVSHNPTQDLLMAISNVRGTLDVSSSDADQSAFAANAILSMQALSHAIQDFTIMEKNSELKKEMLRAAFNISHSLSNIIKNTGDTPADGSKVDLSELKTIASTDLMKIYELIPGKRDFDGAIEEVSTISQTTPVPGEEKETGTDLSVTVQNTVTAFQNAISDLASSAKGSPDQVKEGIAGFKVALKKLNRTSMKIGKGNVSNEISGALEMLNNMSSNFMGSVRDAYLHPDNDHMIDDVIKASKLVSESANGFLGVSLTLKPGEVECLSLLQDITVLKANLGKVDGNVALKEEYSIYALQVTTTAKLLISLGSAFSTSATKKNVPLALKKLSDTFLNLQDLTVNISKIAIIVGISASDAVSSDYELIDRSTFYACINEVNDSIASLIDPKNATKDKISQIKIALFEKFARVVSLCENAGKNSDLSQSAQKKLVAAFKKMGQVIMEFKSDINVYADQIDDDTRENCRIDGEHIKAELEELWNFVQSAEFNCKQIKISPLGLAAQKPLIDTNRSLLETFYKQVETARDVFTDSNNEDYTQILGNKSKEMSDIIQILIKHITSNAPGQQQCQESIGRLNEIIASIVSAILESTMNNLSVRVCAENSAIIESIIALRSLVDLVGSAANTDGARLGAIVFELPNSVSKVVSTVIDYASTLSDTDEQYDLLNCLKDACDSILSFVTSAKSFSLNSSSTDIAKKVDAEKGKIGVFLSKMTNLLQGTSLNIPEFVNTTSRIQKAMTESARAQTSVAGTTFVKCATTCSRLAKAFSIVVTDIIAKGKNLEALRISATELGDAYCAFLNSAMAASAVVDDSTIKTSLSRYVISIGEDSIRFIEGMKLASNKNTSEQNLRSKLTSIAREISSGIVHIFASLKEGNKSAGLCEDVINAVTNIISDIDSSIFFAQAGQLDPLDPKDTFSKYNTALLLSIAVFKRTIIGYNSKTALTAEISVKLATESQKALESLSENIRKGVTSISSSDKNMQVQLLSACKAISENMLSIIQFTISADDNIQSNLKPLLEEEGNLLDEMNRLVSLMADESSRGFRAINNAAHEISDLIKFLESDAPAEGTALPEEVAGLAKQLAVVSVSMAAIPSSKQDELSTSAINVKKLLDALLRAGKATISNAPEDKSKAMMKALMSTATASYAYTLKIRESLDPDAGITRSAIQKLAKDVSVAVTEVVTVTGKLIPGGYVDAKDPNVIAERELLAAASAIDASAKELSILVPTPQSVEEGDELSFEEQLYDLSKAITAATAALVRAATSVQRELGSKGVVKSMGGRNDGAESNGLVSSAKLVCSATQQLCENACTALNGKVNHERIIVSAKAVSTYTTQLLTATSVQSDQNSQNVIRLKAAAKAVTSATENLVRITEESLDSIDEEKISKVSKRNHSVVTAKILELDAQVNILKTEKELEKARNMLAAVRKGKYQERQEEMTTNNLMMRATKTAQKRPSGREMP